MSNVYGRIQVIDENMRAADGPLHPSVIDSCCENAADLGFVLESAEFWAEVLAQLLGELDAAGYNADGTLKATMTTSSSHPWAHAATERDNDPPNGILTVGRLRALLADLPDDIPVVIGEQGGNYWFHNVGSFEVPARDADGEWCGNDWSCVTLWPGEEFDSRQL